MRAASKVIVRARAREDLEALKEQIPSLRIFEDADADYRYRAEKGRRGRDSRRRHRLPELQVAVAERHGTERKRSRVGSERREWFVVAEGCVVRRLSTTGFGGVGLKASCSDDWIHVDRP